MLWIWSILSPSTTLGCVTPVTTIALLTLGQLRPASQVVTSALVFKGESRVVICWFYYPLHRSCFSLKFILKCKAHHQVYGFYSICLDKNMAKMRIIWPWCQNSKNSNNNNSLSVHYDHHFILTITPNSIIYCSNMAGYEWLYKYICYLFQGFYIFYAFLMKIYYLPMRRRS